MKIRIEINFLKVNGIKVDKSMLKRESKLTETALIFTERLGKSLQGDYFKKSKILISDPTYICNWKDEKLFAYIDFTLDSVRGVQIKDGKDTQKSLNAFKKDMEWVLKKLEQHTKKEGIEMKTEVYIENG